MASIRSLISSCRTMQVGAPSSRVLFGGLECKQLHSSSALQSAMRDKLRADMKQAMKAKETFKLSVIRGVLADVTNADKEKGQDIGDSAILALMNKNATKRAETSEFYRTNGRTDLADKESSEREILVSYLPKPLSGGDLDEVLEKIVDEVGASGGKADLGKVKARFFENLSHATTPPGEVVKRTKELLESRK